MANPVAKFIKSRKPGGEEIKRWLSEPPEMPETRNAMLIKIFFGNHMKPSQFAAHLRAWREEHANLLQRYEREVPSVITQYAHTTGAFKDAFYWSLKLDYGRKVDRMVLQWCDEALKQTEDKGKKEFPRKKAISPPQRLKEKLD